MLNKLIKKLKIQLFYYYDLIIKQPIMSVFSICFVILEIFASTVFFFIFKPYAKFKDYIQANYFDHYFTTGQTERFIENCTKFYSIFFTGVFVKSGLSYKVILLKYIPALEELIDQIDLKRQTDDNLQMISDLRKYIDHVNKCHHAVADLLAGSHMPTVRRVQKQNANYFARNYNRRDIFGNNGLIALSCIVNINEDGSCQPNQVAVDRIDRILEDSKNPIEIKERINNCDINLYGGLLAHVCIIGNHKVLATLLKYDLDPTKRQAFGNTAMHWLRSSIRAGQKMGSSTDDYMKCLREIEKFVPSDHLLDEMPNDFGVMAKEITI
jgi:hypothetical protein